MEIIKFGRASYRVEKIHIPHREKVDFVDGGHSRRVSKKVNDPWGEGLNDNLAKTLRNHNENAPKAEEDIKISYSQDLTRGETPIMCRICLGADEIRKGNPLIQPCNCTGSCSLVHYKCITRWIEKKREVRECQVCVSYQWFNIECELCHAKLPEKVQCDKNGKIYRIFKYEEPETLNCAYIVLHSVMELKKTKIVHIINTVGRKTVKVGR
jgi:hypothetical protein